MKQTLLFLVVILMGCATSPPATEEDIKRVYEGPSETRYKGVESYDGFLWVNLEPMQKTMLITGWWLGDLMTRKRILFSAEDSGVVPIDKMGELKKYLDRDLIVAGTVGDMVDELDRYYESYAKRETRLVEAIIDVTGHLRFMFYWPQK